jgi:hypothetical protein
MPLLDDAFALLLSGSRQIGTLVPDIVIREVNRDEMVITDHPVERGAAISDHAFLRPFEVEMQIAWSDSTGGYVGYARDAYEELQQLMQQREPFDVATGKRRYRNMLISGLTCQTDEKTEDISLISVRLREVNIVSTQTTSAPKSAQANPAKTGSTAQAGTQQLQTGPGGRVVGGV